MKATYQTCAMQQKQALTEPSAYVESQERSQVNNPVMYLNQLETGKLNTKHMEEEIVKISDKQNREWRNSGEK